MSEMKFTPGPWHTAGKGLSRYVEGRVRPGVLQEVAWCGATEVPEQMEANACLIATAPELLDLLIKARRYVGMVTEMAGDDPIFGVMDDIDAVIAKAMGA